jgi:hypothetical protein
LRIFLNMSTTFIALDQAGLLGQTCTKDWASRHTAVRASTQGGVSEWTPKESAARRGSLPVPQRREPQRARCGRRAIDLRRVAREEAAGRDVTLPASNAARRASTSVSHAASADSSSSAGRRATRSCLTNSCRSAGGSVIALCRSVSTRLAMVSPVSTRVRCERTTPGRADSCLRIAPC